MMLVSVKYSNQDVLNVKWINDNAAAGKWASVNKCTSSAGHFANIISAWFQITKDSYLSGWNH